MACRQLNFQTISSLHLTSNPDKVCDICLGASTWLVDLTCSLPPSPESAENVSEGRKFALWCFKWKIPSLAPWEDSWHVMMSIEHSGQSHPSFIEGLWTRNRKLLEKDTKQVSIIIISICELSTHSVLSSPHLFSSQEEEETLVFASSGGWAMRGLSPLLPPSWWAWVNGSCQEMWHLLSTCWAFYRLCLIRSSRQPHETGPITPTSYVETLRPRAYITATRLCRNYFREVRIQTASFAVQVLPTTLCCLRKWVLNPKKAENRVKFWNLSNEKAASVLTWKRTIGGRGTYDKAEVTVSTNVFPVETETRPHLGLCLPRKPHREPHWPAADKCPRFSALLSNEASDARDKRILPPLTLYIL